MNWKQCANQRRDVRQRVIDLREHDRYRKRRRCEYPVPVEHRYVGLAVKMLPRCEQGWHRFRCYRTVEEAQRAVEQLSRKHGFAEYRVVIPKEAPVSEFRV